MAECNMTKPHEARHGHSSTTGPGGSPVWIAVDRLAATAPTISDLTAHRLHLVEAHRLRSIGATVPAPLAEAERIGALMRLAAPVVLGRAREAYDGKLVLLKGPEVAASYPNPGMRPFTDLDLLAHDAEGAQQALVRAGFVPLSAADGYDELHHLAPLVLPGLPVIVEVHRTPKWLPWMTPPSNEELFADAVPSAAGAEGILGLCPEHHALVLAAHAWSHAPLGRILDLVDVTAVAGDPDAASLASLAANWGMGRVWRLTTRTIAHVLFGERDSPAALRIWARNLERVSGRTVAAWHLERWIGPYWAMHPMSASKACFVSVRTDLRRVPGETWRDKLTRSCLALRNASLRRVDHDDEWNRRRDGDTPTRGG